jgi:hypothetical protein
MTYNKSKRKGKLSSRNKGRKTRSKTDKTNFKSKRKMKGGFSAFSLWDTMTYNLSNALSTFTISPPTAIGNVSEPVNPSVSKQFLQVK